ncbi:MAG: hypothetical protein EXS63_00215 [Candidatus Omnitrophica bacterium]|nr:hypothetical protein [Candidatus Omnitrophota bacterium]
MIRVRLRQFFFIFTACFQALSFAGAEEAPSAPNPIRIFESENVRLLYRLTGDQIHYTDPDKNETHLEEFMYKFVVLDSKLNTVFGKNHLAELRFLDDHGFIIFEDLIAESDLFAEREYFSYLWTSPEKLREVHGVEAASLEGALEEQARRRYQIQIQELKNAMDRAGEIYDKKIRRVKVQQKEFREGYNKSWLDAFIAGQRKDQPVLSAPPKVPMDSHPNVYQKPVERVTNEDIAEALKKLEGPPPPKVIVGK